MTRESIKTVLCMFSRPSLTVLTIIVIASSALAQRTVRTDVRLRIIVTYEGQREKVFNATVELMDAVGLSRHDDRKETDREGRVEFVTTSGLHRFRVTGAEIEPYEGQFQIEPVQLYHVEYVQVRRRPTTGVASAPAGDTVSAARLNVPDDARAEFEEGAKAMQKQRWADARKRFEAAITQYPSYELAYNGLGVAASQLNDVASARSAFVRAIELNPNFAEALRNLARILIGEKNYTEAAILLNRSLTAEPNHAWALANVAHAELQTKQFAQAAAHARRVHELHHAGLASAHVVAGYALEALGQHEEAASEFGLYLQEDPAGPNVKRVREAMARLQARRNQQLITPTSVEVPNTSGRPSSPGPQWHAIIQLLVWAPKSLSRSYASLSAWRGWGRRLPSKF